MEIEKKKERKQTEDQGEEIFDKGKRNTKRNYRGKEAKKAHKEV